MMGDEIRDPRRNIPRALLIGGVLITAALHPLDRGDAGGAAAGADPAPPGLHARDPDRRPTGSGIGGLTAVTALLITLGGLGQAGAWFAAGGRLPFVAGIDRFLPPAFGRIHPRYGSPHVSLLVQAAIAAVFIFLGQAGTTVKGAYDVLVSMAIICYFIPYLFMFASMIKLQREPAGPEVMRVPGGRPVATLLGARRLLRHRRVDRPRADSGGGRAEQGARGHQGGGAHGRCCVLGGARGLLPRTAEAGMSGATRSAARPRRGPLADGARAHRRDGAALLRLHPPGGVRPAAPGRPGRARAQPGHPAGRAGDRGLLAPHLGLRALGQHRTTTRRFGRWLGSAGR